MVWIVLLIAAVVLVILTRAGFLDFTSLGVGYYRIVYNLAQAVGLQESPEPEGPFKSATEADDISRERKASVVQVKFFWRDPRK